MGLYNFLWDVAQSSHLSELDDEIEKLKAKNKEYESRIDILEQWIVYLNERLGGNEQEQKP